jgi:hypothetical protein
MATLLPWFRDLVGRTNRCRRRAAKLAREPRARNRARLQLTLLEDRTVPSLFGAPTPFAVGFQPSTVVVGDFNGDGTPDLAVANRTSNTVSILLDKGDGTFKPAVTYAVGKDPDALVWRTSTAMASSTSLWPTGTTRP